MRTLASILGCTDTYNLFNLGVQTCPIKPDETTVRNFEVNEFGKRGTTLLQVKTN